MRVLRAVAAALLRAGGIVSSGGEMRTRHVLRTGVVAMVLVLAACATATGRGALENEDAVRVRVKNNLQPPASLTVSIVPTNGARQMLGVIEPSATKVLRFEQQQDAFQYRLVAETAAGVPISSRPFTLEDVATVEWDLSLNTIDLHSRS